MTEDEIERVAEKVATTVAQRCHGNRKPGAATQRYAIIWQAARLGAIETLSIPDAGKQCSMGVGCDQHGVCYAEAHGQPEQCPHFTGDAPDTPCHPDSIKGDT